MVCSIAIAIVKANQAHKAKKTTDGDGMQRIHFHAVNDAILPKVCPWVRPTGEANEFIQEEYLDEETGQSFVSDWN